MEYSKKKCKKCFGGLIMVRVLKLRNIRIKEQKKLNENNFCLYKHIIAYIKATNLTIYEKEEILHQIMDMLLEAQYENRDKSFIVGDDYKKFCKSIIDEYMLTKSKVYIVLDYVQRYVLWMIIGLGLEGFYNLFLINQLTITLNDIFTWNMISLFIVFISKSVTREAIVVPISEKSKIKININFNNSKLASCLLGIFILSLILQLVSRHLFNIDPYTYVILLKSNVFIIISIILLVVVGISIYKYQYVKRY
jgi:DNA-binding ferritin-like protein (Dps family)